MNGTHIHRLGGHEVLFAMDEEAGLIHGTVFVDGEPCDALHGQTVEIPGTCLECRVDGFQITLTLAEIVGLLQVREENEGSPC